MLLGLVSLVWSSAVLEGGGRHVFSWWRHPLGVQTLESLECQVGSFSDELLWGMSCWKIKKTSMHQWSFTFTAAVWSWESILTVYWAFADVYWIYHIYLNVEWFASSSMDGKTAVASNWSIAQGETAADYLRPQLAEKYRDCPCPAELLELRHLDSWTVAKSCQIRIDHWTPSCHQDLPVHLFVADYRGYGALQSDSGHLELKFGSLCDQRGRLVRRGTFVGNFPEGRTAPRRNGHNAFQIQQRICPCRDFCSTALTNFTAFITFWDICHFGKGVCFYAKQM